MKEAIFFIALPGAGKTTYIKENFDLANYKIISADVLKENHLSYDPNKAHELHQWSVKQAEQLIYTTIENGSNFILDGGGINNSYTLRIMNRVKEAGYNIKLIYINTSLYECLRRLSLRERKVPIEDVFNKAMKLPSCLAKQKLICDDFVQINWYTDKNFIFDMDGTLCEYITLPLKCEFAPPDMTMDYINNNIFEYIKPVREMIGRVYKLKDKSNIYILSVSPNSETNKQKIAWLKNYLPFLDEDKIYFVGSIEKKIDVLQQIMEKHKLNIHDVTYVDDLHPMLWAAVNGGINALHPSAFLSNY